MANQSKKKTQEKGALSKFQKQLIALVAVIALVGAGVYWYVTGTHAGGLIEVPAKEATFYQAYTIAEFTGKGAPVSYLKKYGTYFVYPTTSAKGTLYKISGWYEGGNTTIQVPYSSIVVYRGTQYTKGPRIKYVTDENGNIRSVTIFALPTQNIFAPAMPNEPSKG